MRSGDPIFVQAHDSYASPLHVDDIIRQVPELWRIASRPAVTINWGNDECVSEREMIAYVSDLIGSPAKIEVSDLAAIMVADDPSLRQSLIGGTEVSWQDGIRRAIEEYYPGAIT